MASTLHSVPDRDLASQCFAEALRHHSPVDIARQLGVRTRTIRHWIANQSVPQSYVFGLQRLLPLAATNDGEAPFSFIDLVAGIGGIRMAFEELGGRCLFTSEWDSYAQKAYAENYPATHAINGDISQLDAVAIPDHDLLLAGFPCQPFSIAGARCRQAGGGAPEGETSQAPAVA